MRLPKSGGRTKYTQRQVEHALRLWHRGGLSLSQAAARAGMPRGTLGRYVHGKGSAIAAAAYAAICAEEQAP